MRSRRCGGGLVGPLLLVASASCSVRVGSGMPDKPDNVPPPACARVGNELKLPFGEGSQAFSFVWDVDHYVVAYADSMSGNGDIYVARLAADGSAMGTPVAVESTPAQSDLPDLI